MDQWESSLEFSPLILIAPPSWENRN
jgi:hypothetical protein